LLKGPIGFALVSMRDRSLRAADANVVIGERMAARLQANGIARVHIIPNWTDDEAITPLSLGANPLRERWFLRDRFVVGYSGNLGRAHEFETILAAAEHLRNYSSIVFVFIGAGQQFEELRQRVRELRFEDRFRFLPYQDRDQLKFSLSVPDVHWISLKPALEGLIFPSKFYGIAAAGRPVIAVAATNGELARWVQAHQCGYAVVPGDSIVLAERIRELSTRPELCASMGARARAMLEANFSRRQAFARWRSVLAEL
jgi:glycosyltransferase involved in cell wall biosynthesis